MLYLPELLPMRCSAMPFLSWGAPLLFSSFSDIHTTSACLKSSSVPYSPPPGILSVHTFCTPHTILSLPLYTTPALTGMPRLEYPFYSAPVPFVIRYVLDSSSTPFPVPLVAWPHMLPFLPLTTSFLLSKENTLCTCVPLLHT